MSTRRSQKSKRAFNTTTGTNLRVPRHPEGCLCNRDARVSHSFSKHANERDTRHNYFLALLFQSEKYDPSSSNITSSLLSRVSELCPFHDPWNKF